MIKKEHCYYLHPSSLPINQPFTVCFYMRRCMYENTYIDLLTHINQKMVAMYRTGYALTLPSLLEYFYVQTPNNIPKHYVNRFGFSSVQLA